MRWRVLVAIVTAGLLFHVPSSDAAEVWRIACDDNFPPYNFVDGDKVVGLDAEIVAALVKQAGAEVDFEPQPWSRVQDMLERGEVDAAFQFVGRPDRFEKYFMIGPHRMGRTVFAARSDRDIAVRGLDDLRGYRIGTVRGYTYGAAFDGATHLSKDMTAGDNLQLVRMLVAGRVDLIIGDREALMHFARNAGLHTQMQVLQPAFSEVPRYIAVPRSKPEIAARLEKALTDLRRNGRLAEILRRWE
ncbi:MAG: amino acid ABC transporter substrate-binding protein [Alphaproteobacteria bacterium]|nr:amino acid ABC transporter substrate-binding protein [Alphaproteobacteria bacterium]